MCSKSYLKILLSQRLQTKTHPLLAGWILGLQTIDFSKKFTGLKGNVSFWWTRGPHDVGKLWIHPEPQNVMIFFQCVTRKRFTWKKKNWKIHILRLDTLLLAKVEQKHGCFFQMSYSSTILDDTNSYTFKKFEHMPAEKRRGEKLLFSAPKRMKEWNRKSSTPNRFNKVAKSDTLR